MQILIAIGWRVGTLWLYKINLFPMTSTVGLTTVKHQRAAVIRYRDSKINHWHYKEEEVQDVHVVSFGTGNVNGERCRCTANTGQVEGAVWSAALRSTDHAWNFIMESQPSFTWVEEPAFQNVYSRGLQTGGFWPKQLKGICDKAVRAWYAIARTLSQVSQVGLSH